MWDGKYTQNDFKKKKKKKQNKIKKNKPIQLQENKF